MPRVSQRYFSHWMVEWPANTEALSDRLINFVLKQFKQREALLHFFYRRYNRTSTHVCEWSWWNCSRIACAPDNVSCSVWEHLLKAIIYVFEIVFSGSTDGEISWTSRERLYSSLLTSRWFFKEKGTNEKAHAFLTKVRTLPFSESLWKYLLRPVHSQKCCGFVHLINVIFLLLFLLSSTKSMTHQLKDAFPHEMKIVQKFISRFFIRDCVNAVFDLVKQFSNQDAIWTRRIG